MKLSFLYTLLFVNLIYAQSNEIKNKVVILSPNYVDIIDHKGCIDLPLEFLEDYIKLNHPSEFVELDYKKLRKNNVESLYIYNKKYCKPIGKVLDANLFVMTNIKMVSMNSSYCADITYNIEMKAYSMFSNKEIILLNLNDVTIEAFQKEVELKLESYFQKIISLNQQ